jgi:uncharacterized protein (TIGR00725 family)
MPHLPVITVIGSGDYEHEELAGPLGQWLARQGFHLLTGGGAGVMLAVSRAFHAVQPRAGLVLGIVPGQVDATHYQRRPRYPNEFVEVAIFTHLPLSGKDGMRMESRNHINVLSGDVVVALPGAEGTATEAHLAVRYHRPIIAYSNDPIPATWPTGLPVAQDLAAVQSFVQAQTKGWLSPMVPLVDTQAPYALE